MANFALELKQINLNDFKRNVEIYENHFWIFYNEQNIKVQQKIDWTVTLIQTTKVIPDKYFKHLTNTEGLWEIRVSANNGIFRIFYFFDKENLVLLINGFQKKMQKTPRTEIKKAEKLKRQYYENK